MEEFEKLGKFYLGRRYDLFNKKPKNELVLYDSRDLVTHAICIGMTGSGKTGLCLNILEEAIVDGIPVIAIDPKGDLSNLLLTFPNLTQEDFLQWVDEEEARRRGITPAELALNEAEKWKAGLADWGQGGARVQKLRDSAEFAVYTPGSKAGLPISILKSFAAPPKAMLEESDFLRDTITNSATSLLALIGISADPLKSREHILVSSLLYEAWKKQEDLTLLNLIQQIQKPPITHIGAMDLESFFPSNDRFEFAMTLNNLLAAPGLDAWLDGDPLDIDKFFYTKVGRPRVSIFSIAHLNDAERMFFVSLLLNQVLSWMRMQSGTTSLRAILYMDEIFGYFPPIANPPSKTPLLTLLKQGRAFGLGVLLASQNPVDLDYKGLANTGTWFIGRLQTERDKMRVLEGLEGASVDAGSDFDRQKMESILAALGTRIFLINNVHDDGPDIFETRWTMSYLRGPLTRNQIKRLMDPLKAQPASESTKTERGEATHQTRRDVQPETKTSPPPLRPAIPRYYLPLKSNLSDHVVYQCKILGCGLIKFVDTKYDININQQRIFIAPITDEAIPVNWANANEVKLAIESLEKIPLEKASFVMPPSVVNKEENYKTWGKEFAHWLYANQKYHLLKSPSLKIVSRQGESERDFRIRVNQSGKEKRDELVRKLTDKYAPKLVALKERIRLAQQDAERETEKAKENDIESAISLGATVFDAFMGRRRINSSTLSRATSAARGINKASKKYQEVARAQETVQSLLERLAELESEFQGDKAALAQKFQFDSEPFETIVVTPKRSTVSVQLLALLWLPHICDDAGKLVPVWQ